MKKLGRWFVVLLILELILAFWVGNRIRNRFEAPIRIIGQTTTPSLPCDGFARTTPGRA